MPKQQKTGTIVSDKMDKTRVVEVNSYKLHPKYNKKYRVTKKYKAHDEKNITKQGDRVIIQESRPLSRTKRWYIVGQVDIHGQLISGNKES